MSLLNLFKKNLGTKISQDNAVILTNDATNLCYEASKSCYGTQLTDDYRTKLKYIGARNKEGHESIIEHSNICMIVSLKNKDLLQYAQIANGFRYLNVETSTIMDITYFLIGGSIRGYKHLIRETIFQNNMMLNSIKNLIYECCYREFFVDLIQAGVMNDTFMVPGQGLSSYDAERDLTIEDEIALWKDINSKSDLRNKFQSINPDKIEITNIDNIQSIYDYASLYGFNMEQCLSMASVTVLFKGMSTIITRELNRHRNGITQESQRYVNVGDLPFNSPANFKDKYDKNKKYTYNIGNVTCEGTMQEIGDNIRGVYKNLIDQGVEKEDARGYLPSNVQSSKVYMTFTYRSFIAFLKLRTDSHAQAEIREYAFILYEDFNNYINKNNILLNEDIYYYMIPRCMKTEDPDYQNKNIDEGLSDIKEFNEVVEYSIPIGKDSNESISVSSYDSSLYADTREDDKAIKEAESGRKDV